MSNYKTVPNIFIKNNISPNDSVLVLYPKNRVFDLSMINAYMTAAQNILKSCDLNNLSAGDDILALPILNLYVNALEFALKNVILKLESHRLKGKCTSISPPPNGFEIKMNRHNLGDLADILSTVLSKSSKKLHSLRNKKYIISFLKSLQRHGVHSESTRYYGDIKGRIYPLHKGQTAIRLLELHKSISKICNDLIFLVMCSEFEFCDCGEFSKKRRTELRYTETIMKRHKKIFSSASKKKVTLNETLNISKLLSKASNSLTSDIKLIENLKKISKTDKAYLVMGLYFSRGAIHVEHVQHFMSWTEENIDLKITGRASHYQQASISLKKHIKYVTGTLQKK